MNQIYQNLNKLKKIKFCQDLNKYIEKELFIKNIILLNIYYKEIFSNTNKSNINKLKNQYYMNNKIIKKWKEYKLSSWKNRIIK